MKSFFFTVGVLKRLTFSLHKMLEMQQLIWAGKNKELTVPRVLLWPTFFIRTEMLPVERVVADWERPANLAPLYSLASQYKNAKACHRLPVEVRQILSKYEMKRMALAIFVPNLAGIHQPVDELDQTAIHPALSPVLAILSGKKKRQIILADLTPPRGKSAENSWQKSWPLWSDIREEVWFGSF